MVVDSYVHLCLPRFQSIEDELAVMRRYSIDKAIVCPFESCPDLEMVHRAFTANPERFRGRPSGWGRSHGNDRRSQRSVRGRLRWNSTVGW